MNAKKQKLEKQAPSVDMQSSVFKGISVFVNGYTGMHIVFEMTERVLLFCYRYFVFCFIILISAIANL